LKFSNLLVEKKDGLGWITFNRPDVLNALNVQSRRELIACLAEMEQDPSVVAVVLTGSGDKAFCAGADMKLFLGLTRKKAQAYVRLAKATTKKIEELKKPVIAAVNGLALGTGCEIALACDLVIASKNAKFGQPELNVGLIPGAGGTQRLPRIVGLKVAKELIFTGRLLDAHEGKELGLVNRVVEAGHLQNAVEEVARRLKEKSPLILQFAKRSINKAVGTDLQAGLNYESKLFAQCFRTEDQKEGVSAFLEKRQPHFKGR